MLDELKAALRNCSFTLLLRSSDPTYVVLRFLDHEFSGLLNAWSCEQWSTGFQGLNIRCARVAGVELPKKKRIETALQYIHGVGQTTARKVLLSVGLENKITSELSEEELTRIRDELSN